MICTAWRLPPPSFASHSRQSRRPSTATGRPLIVVTADLAAWNPIVANATTGTVLTALPEEVPADAILGAENDGFKVMVTTLNGGRLFIASLALASLAFALDKTRIYAEERVQFDNKPIGRFQRVQDVIVDMDIALERGLTWLMHCCKRFEAGTLSREQAAKVKVDCSRTASDLVQLAMEACGGVSCFDEFGLIRHHNDLFVTRVGEGSNFALKDLIVRPLRQP
ncbi:MAG: acyl-CoA dehydrogenase family protein [Planctomycetota bacterium]